MTNFLENVIVNGSIALLKMRNTYNLHHCMTNARLIIMEIPDLEIFSRRRHKINALVLGAVNTCVWIMETLPTQVSILLTIAPALQPILASQTQMNSV